ncbi:pseudouridine synthase [Dermatophilus congolensis]|uniref:pseudouridine synthase n=1 Tax=Dermatophilus congolensis TaxID=1863 RepID=UPI001AB01D1A|nr:pseudouridine synthase [Dermatophilus congolensis]MBO3142789.1 rRNA pseudouridine synthase [Dermatophilus congolensis]MBO3151782.1 rRNA pseudouridine synthase [Dermatophilus congolensis]MBO3161215.1 rRNA pseudouridine synthase [Dermatophilus congolensis]MBO3163064.1 rRNA pseudouridine synthase [Dermatophilus congolensis]MBO3176617.1 rRNA pseudouridine synthase [Dermatophilus congolensis]
MSGRSGSGARRSGGSGGPKRGSGYPKKSSGGGRAASAKAGRKAVRQPRRGRGDLRPDQLAPRENRAPVVDVHDPDGVRLQKLLASAGVGSRRACEALIEQGRVEVDDQVVTELGIRIDPLARRVRVDGQYINLDSSRSYYALNKPVGVVSSMDDEFGRPDISYMLFNRQERLFHVGRLDADTSGLLLLTNDGELAHRLQHPSYEVAKTYVASVPGPIPRDLGRRLREGVELEEGLVQVDSFKLIDSTPGKALVEVVLHEGKKHVVRRLLDAVGHPVLTLTRIAVGPIRLGDQKSGRLRELNSKEIADLYAAAGL